MIALLNNRTLNKCLVYGGKNRRGMLGFTCNKESVHLRVLLAEENHLHLYRLPELCFSPEKLKESLSIVAELFLAFTSFIDTTF